MSNKYVMIQNEVNTGTVKIETVFELAKIERRRIKEGAAVMVDLDKLKCGRFGLTAREAMFAYLVACSEGVNKDAPIGFNVSRKKSGKKVAYSPSDIAIQCGFDASEGEAMMSDRSIKQAIKEYSLVRLRMNDNPVDDLRSIALSRLASSASANVDSIIEYQSDRDARALKTGEVPDGNYYGYIPMAGGSMVRIKQMGEIPDHVALAIKSFKIRNEGTKEFPILVPDIEFYDGVRAAELILKYTGDIGNKNGGEDVASTVRDIVGMIDKARRRNNERSSSSKALEEVNVIDTEFEEASSSKDETDTEFIEEVDNIEQEDADTKD